MDQLIQRCYSACPRTTNLVSKMIYYIYKTQANQQLQSGHSSMKTFVAFLSSTPRIKPVPLQVEQTFMQDIYNQRMLYKNFLTHKEILVLLLKSHLRVYFIQFIHNPLDQAIESARLNKFIQANIQKSLAKTFVVFKGDIGLCIIVIGHQL